MFKVYDYEIGDQFPCYLSFDTGYCTDYGALSNDYSGFGEGSVSEEGFDHRNRICCEPNEIPLMVRARRWQW